MMVDDILMMKKLASLLDYRQQLREFLESFHMDAWRNMTRQYDYPQATKVRIINMLSHLRIRRKKVEESYRAT